MKWSSKTVRNAIRNIYVFYVNFLQKNRTLRFSEIGISNVSRDHWPTLMSFTKIAQIEVCLCLYLFYEIFYDRASYQSMVLYFYFTKIKIKTTCRIQGIIKNNFPLNILNFTIHKFFFNTFCLKFIFSFQNF